MARKTAQQLFDEMDEKFSAFAREVGDQIQSLQDGGIGENGLRRVSPPANESSPGQIGDVATDGENAYFYIGNGTIHKWGQAPLITEFIR